jgi:hypothetical protein
MQECNNRSKCFVNLLEVSKFHFYSKKKIQFLLVSSIFYFQTKHNFFTWHKDNMCVRACDACACVRVCARARVCVLIYPVRTRYNVVVKSY